MNIFLIRHGRQNSTLCNVNVELSKEGRRQAELTGERIKDYAIEAVYSSDLIRAVETADIINQYVGAPRFIDPRYQELNFGELTGLSNEVLKERFKDFLDYRSTMQEDVAYPGGECGREAFDRAYQALLDITKQDYENVAIVTHGGVIRALTAGLMGGNFNKCLVVGRQIENCSISELLYDRDMNTFHIERLNDYAHIEKYDELRRKHFSTGFFTVKNEQDNN